MASWTLNHHWGERQHDGTVSASVVAFEGDTLKVMILDSTGSAALDETADTEIDDVSANEVSGSNYTAGGPTLDNVTVTESGGVVTVDADDETISQHASGFSDGRALVLYKDTGTPATSIIIAHLIAASDFGNVDGDLTLQPAVTGLFTFDMAP